MTYIQQIKTFTAPLISNLSLENIKYVALQVRKNTRQNLGLSAEFWVKCWVT